MGSVAAVAVVMMMPHLGLRLLRMKGFCPPVPYSIDGRLVFLDEAAMAMLPRVIWAAATFTMLALLLLRYAIFTYLKRLPSASRDGLRNASPQGPVGFGHADGITRAAMRR